MRTDDLTIYDAWDLTDAPRLPHSRLFALEAIGLGTPMTESLTGYVARLADAHGLSPRQLVLHEILPLLGRRPVASDTVGLLSSFWDNHARGLNGTTPLACRLVRALATLTGRHDLHALTFIPWGDVLSVRQVQRVTRAWCPLCYEEWRQARHPIYEPLIWSLTPISLCPRHHRRLQVVCPFPDCQRSSPVLAPRSRPGWCARCKRWLGCSETPASPASDVSVKEVRVQAWTTAAIGELIAAAPGLPNLPRQEWITRALASSVEHIAGGNRTAWARQLGLTMETVANWQWGRTKPSLDLLLHVCSHLGTTPLPFLQGDPPGAFPPASEMFTRDDFRHGSPPVRRIFDRAATRRALESILARAEQPAPSLATVARRLGQARASLRRHLPDLCRAISQRYLLDQKARGDQTRQRLGDEIRQVTVRIHDQGLYPSARRVAALLAEPGSIRSRAGLAAWHALLRELGW